DPERGRETAILGQDDLTRLTILQSGCLFPIWLITRATATVRAAAVGLPEGTTHVKMHLIGGAILSAVLAGALACPAQAADTRAQAAPAAGTPSPQAATTAPTDRLTAADLGAWLDGFMPYALEKND